MKHSVKWDLIMSVREKFNQENFILTIDDVAELMRKSRVSIWRWERDGVLPIPVRINGKVIGWRRSVFLEWMESKEVR